MRRVGLRGMVRLGVKGVGMHARKGDDNGNSPQLQTEKESEDDNGNRNDPIAYEPRRTSLLAT
jgi:hypothetical protein